ncbi:MAG: alcohol dehydrogenase catalytic domain-containing protein [Acidobacteriota bacterium]|nr:alcohol dehydrogenase catalytic domain-containing protein [Acidobacteriota bacterium]MDH3786460.1 alcohol dehydrogenase catalytic domain-containing protein [Acidobacteriota bacterium]
MQAITYVDQMQVQLDSVEDPRVLESGDAIVAVSLAGICGSDLHVLHGRESGIDVGTVMGHEFVGEVVEVGSSVHTVRPGKRVMSPFTTSCGHCYFCGTGLTSRCDRSRLFGWVQNGVGLQGAQAQYIRVPDADGTLLELESDIDESVGVLLGDILSTGYFCALQAGVEADGVYVVVGCGPVGLLTIAAARHLGATCVYAVDRVADRLLRAVDFGAIPIDGATEDVVARLHSENDGRGADAVMEVVGNADAHRLAIDLLRPGGTLSVVGVHNEPQFSFSPTEAYDKNLTYRVGRCPARHLMEQLLPFARDNQSTLASLVSHVLPLADGAHGYDIFDRKLDGCTKVVLRV